MNGTISGSSSLRCESSSNQANAHVAFDVDSSGYLKNTAWASKQDGFLVLDRNYNSLGAISPEGQMHSDSLMRFL